MEFHDIGIEGSDAGRRLLEGIEGQGQLIVRVGMLLTPQDDEFAAGAIDRELAGARQWHGKRRKEKSAARVERCRGRGDGRRSNRAHS
jgi:hypothetical protein